MTTRRIEIHDTTLRDGEQAPGNSLTPEERVDMAHRLVALGIDTLEAGFPAVSEDDFRLVAHLAREVRDVGLCAFARCTERDILISAKALEQAERPRIQLLAVGSDIHLHHKRRATRAQATEEMVSSIRLCHQQGIDDISVAIEDVTRARRDFVEQLCRVAVDEGATRIGFPDTVGCALPAEIADLVVEARGWIPGTAIAVHCHDDLGLAVANSIAGLQAGADEVQVTIGGIGERAGNAALEEVAATLATKDLGLATGIRLDGLQETAATLFAYIRQPIPRNKAVLGVNAFSTEAGLHQHGILNNPDTYEFLKPEMFGRERSLMIGRHSGRNLVREAMRRAGRADDASEAARLYDEFMAGRLAVSDLDGLVAHLKREGASRPSAGRP